MRIIQLIHQPQLRGAETFASVLGNHLLENGDEVQMVTIYDGAEKLPFHGIIKSLQGNKAKTFYDLAAWKKLGSIIADFNPDIVQANAGDTWKYAVLSKLYCHWKQPIVFRNASMMSMYVRNSWTKLLYGFFLSKTKSVISVSASSAKDFISLFPSGKQKLSVIPVGIEEMEFKIEKPVNRNPVLIHVGGFSFEKNHQGLLRIFKKILVRIPELQLWLVGDGILKKKMEELSKENGLENNIRFLGYQSNPLSLIQQADVLLLPSIIEGLPAVILEAFYCKTPVVAYNVGGISEIVEHEITGYLIDKNEEDSFADAVVKLLSQTALKEKMIANAFELVKAKFLNRQLAGEFRKAYSRITAKNISV